MYPTYTPPTMYPTHSTPTMHPTASVPTPFPTDSPPTSYPTEIAPTTKPTIACKAKNEPCTKHEDCCSENVKLKREFVRSKRKTDACFVFDRILSIFCRNHYILRMIFTW